MGTGRGGSKGASMAGDDEPIHQPPSITPPVINMSEKKPTPGKRSRWRRSRVQSNRDSHSVGIS